jgi:hypothetical protein
MSVASLMDSYRRLAGSTIEAVTRRVASWSTPGAPAPHGQELDILVLDNLECLDDEVLQELFAPPEGDRQHWPPILLVAGESLGDRLAARALADDRPTIGVHFDLLRLMPHEVGSFIRYQLTAAAPDQLAIFKPPVIELIEIYADGDPIVVNSLARRLLRIVPELAARHRNRAYREDDNGTDKVAPAAAEPALPDRESLPGAVESSVLSTVDVVPAQAPIARPLSESASAATDAAAILPLAPVLDLGEERTLAAPEPRIAQAPEPTLPVDELYAAPEVALPIVQAPVPISATEMPSAASEIALPSAEAPDPRAMMGESIAAPDAA